MIPIPVAKRCGFLALLALTLVLSGCGRRGPLELPPGAEPIADPRHTTPLTEENTSRTDLDPAYDPTALARSQPQGAGQGGGLSDSSRSEFTAAPAKKGRTFFFDPLL